LQLGENIMTEKEKRRILKRLRRTITKVNVLFRTLELQFNDRKNIQSSKSKSKRKKLK